VTARHRHTRTASACAPFRRSTPTRYEVQLAQGFCIAALIGYLPVDLPAGQSLVITNWWTPATSRVDGQPLEPGPYALRGRVAGDDRAIYSRFTNVTLIP